MDIIILGIGLSVIIFTAILCSGKSISFADAFRFAFSINNMVYSLVMTQKDRILLKNLLTEQRVLSLSVMVEGKPYVSLLPFAFQFDLCAAIIHASSCHYDGE